MAIEMIRVKEPQAATWAGWAWEQAKERPYLAVLAAPAAVVAAPFIATTTAAVGAAAATAVAAAGASELIWGPSAQPTTTIYTIAEAAGMLDVRGQQLEPDEIYLRHPRRTESAVIIRSSDFHSYIMSQKVAEIVDYMRSETRLKSLSILIRSSDSKHAVVGGKLEAVPVKLRGGLRQQHEQRMDLTYDDPSRTPHRGEYVWISDFPEVIAATRSARRGTMSFSQSTDMGFGISGNAAKFAKLEAGWLKTFVVEIDASFA